MNAAYRHEWNADLLLIQATLRINTLIFAAIFGLIAGLALVVLVSVAAVAPHSHVGLTVVLLGVFLPGYANGWSGAVAGALWGIVIGAVLGGSVYWVQARNVLEHAGMLVVFDHSAADFPAAALRLHGSSLGLAIGALGALGLIIATNWLVLRGTAGQSSHARLLAEVFPGYAVDLWGSLVGGVELFAVLYVLSQVFAFVYNRCAALRQQRH